MGEYRTGSNAWPARAPRVTGAYGGRQVVVPVSPIVAPVARATAATVLTVSSLPWTGPMVAVVKRLASSALAYPSATAATMSLDDTSSLKSTNPCVRPRNSSGCGSTGSAGMVTGPGSGGSAAPVAADTTTSDIPISDRLGVAADTTTSDI